MIDPVIVGGFVTTVGKSNLVNTLRDGAVNFLADKAKGIVGDELTMRIESLRSDAKLNKQIQRALERAARRWAEDSPDDELISAVAKNTFFVDLPSIQRAVREIAQNPFNKSTAQGLQSRFQDVLPTRFEDKRIERGVNEFINVLQEEFIAIPILQPTIQTFASLNTANATAVLPHIDQLLEQLIKGPSATEETLQNYLTWVIDQHRYLDPKGTLQTTRQVQVFLDEVYVSLEADEEEPLSSIDRKLYEDELKTIEEHEDLRIEEQEDLLENLQAKFIKVGEQKALSKPVELTELAHKHEKMVVLGDPGAGKTTLLRYLALRHAQARLQFSHATEELCSVLLPVYLRIAEYAENGNRQSLEDFLIENVRGREHHDKSFSDLISTYLNNGACIVFLDGLDEVIEPNQRALISTQINILIRTYVTKGNRFVVTSRVAGYRTSPLDGSIPHYRVRDMNPDQIRRFLNQWCNAVERFQTPALTSEAQQITAQKEIDSIMRAIETTPGVKRLAANPLLLRTLALIHKTGARIPQRRIELYRLAADTLITDWELAKGIPQEALAREADANRLLAELAAWMHENRPAGLATEGDIKRKLCESIAPLRGKEVDHPDIEYEADDFLNKIRHHTGLFVERAPKRFGFMHLTFEEYFAARWLVAKPRDAAKRIRNKLHRPRWDEPILLAIGFYGMEFPDDVTELIEGAILGKDLGGPSPYEEVLFRDLLFAVRAVGDQDVNASLRNELANQFADLWLDEKKAKSKYQGNQSRVEDIMSAIQESPICQNIFNVLLNHLKGDSNLSLDNIGGWPFEHLTLSAEIATEFITTIKEEKNESIRNGTAFALCNTRLSNEVIPILVTALKEDNNDEVRDCAAEALGSVIHLPNVKNALLTAFVEDSNAEVRFRSGIGFEIIPHTPEIINILLKTLWDDKSDDVRAQAARSLGNDINIPEVITALISTFNSDNEQVRQSVVAALGNALDIIEVKDLLIKALTEEPQSVRESAASVLYKATHVPEVISALLSFEASNPHMRESHAYELRNAILSAESIDTLINALRENKNDRVRANAAIALGNALSVPEAVNTLITSLKEENNWIRACVAYTLYRPKLPPEVVNALLITLKEDSYDDVRGRAALALGNVANSQEVINALFLAIKEGNAIVRAPTASALGNIAHIPEVVSVLLAIFKEEKDDKTRVHIVRALHNAFPTPEIVDILLGALHEDKEHMCTGAAYALYEMTKRHRIENMPDLPEKLLVALEIPEVADKYDTYEYIFGSLNNLAPFPTV